MAHLSLTENLLAAATAGGGISGLAAFLTWQVKRREARETATKYMVDTAKSLTETSLSLLEPVRAAALAAENQVSALQAQHREMENVVAALTESLDALTAHSQAEREQLQSKLAEVEAEREKLAAELELAVAELAGLRTQGTVTS